MKRFEIDHETTMNKHFAHRHNFELTVGYHVAHTLHVVDAATNRFANGIDINSIIVRHVLSTASVHSDLKKEHTKHYKLATISYVLPYMCTTNSIPPSSRFGFHELPLLLNPYVQNMIILPTIFNSTCICCIYLWRYSRHYMCQNATG